MHLLLTVTTLFWTLPLPNTADVWPSFRGPSSNGHSPANGLPLTWSETENVKWKTPIHGKGWSTPAVWGDQIWMTTATEDGKEMYAICLDRETGKVLLDKKLFTNTVIEPLGNDVNSYASPSPTIEEGRVYLHFGSYGTACLDTKTFNALWERRDLPCRHYRGPSSSPVLFENLVILTFDGADLQYTAALNKKTGVTVWKTDRSADWNDLDEKGKPYADGDMRKAHSTPVITTVNGQPLMVSVGAKAAYGYDPRNGKEVWKVNYKGFSSSLVPVIAGEHAVITTGYGGAQLYAVRLDSKGTVPDSGIAWRHGRMVPSKPSPILVDGLLHMVNDSGVVTCVDARTGELVWQERIGGNFSASPVYADGRLYLCSEQGKTTVLKPGRKLEVLAESQLKDGFMASPAVAGKALYLRSKTAVYRIEK
jgi:outer membrane protein assembly factor BamB